MPGSEQESTTEQDATANAQAQPEVAPSDQPAPKKKKRRKSAERIQSPLYKYVLIPILWEIYKLFRITVDRMEPDQVYMVMRSIALVAWYVSREHRLRAIRNLEICFGDQYTPKERYRIAKASHQHFVLGATDLFLLQRYYQNDKWRKYVTVTPEMERWAEELTDYEGSVAFHTGHIGSWELTAGLAGLMGKKLNMVYRPLDIPQFQTELHRLRTYWGNEAYTKQGALRGYTKTLRSGGWLGVIADQNAGRGAAFLNFFGVPASTEVSYFKLYQRFQPRVLGIFGFREGFKFKFHFEGFFEGYVDPNADEVEEALRLGQWYNDLMEKMARKYPEQYLWSHKRFAARPGDAPKFYEDLGRPLRPELLAAQPKAPIPPRKAQRNA